MKLDIRELIKAARGEEPVDLLLTGGKLVNVISGEIYPEDVAIHKGYIVGFGSYRAKEKINLRGQYICPGFIDGHVHIESSMVTIPEFARAVVPCGVTSVITDAHEIANVLGIDGIRYMLESSRFQPLNVFFMLPSCVPATNLETSGARLTGFDLYPFLTEKWVVGLGEVMDYPGLIVADENLIDKIKITIGKRIDGHAPGLSGRDLSAYIVSGVASDHESTTAEEAKEKLRKGMFVMIREGTSTRNLDAILPLVNKDNYRYFVFVTDDRHPHDLLFEGSINFLIKKSISLGLDPITAIRIATINTAEYFKLSRLGAVSPGYQADIAIVDNLKDFNIKMVFRRGELVAKDGKFIGKKVRSVGDIRGSINVKWLYEKDFRLTSPRKFKEVEKAQIIEIVPEQIVTKRRFSAINIKNGVVISDPKRDILKLVVVERHHASGNIGKGLVSGFGLKRGAIASSVAHDSHNIICVGVDDKSIFNACVEIVKIGGGLTIADKGKILGRLPLPIGGLMSEKPLAQVNKELNKLISITKKLGCKLSDPFMQLSFLALPVIPELKLTDKGLVDVKKYKIVNLFV
ncbi:MAG: adenine deaminase [Elusimicrobiota bacterium]|nr:adenine deaminase [Elusimicrobiota bacterium]